MKLAQCPGAAHRRSQGMPKARLAAVRVGRGKLETRAWPPELTPLCSEGVVRQGNRHWQARQGRIRRPRPAGNNEGTSALGATSRGPLAPGLFLSPRSEMFQKYVYSGQTLARGMDRTRSRPAWPSPVPAPRTQVRAVGQGIRDAGGLTTATWSRAPRGYFRSPPPQAGAAGPHDHCGGLGCS